MRKSAIADPCVHLRSTTITAAATPVRETRPQTRWEAAGKRRNGSPSSLSAIAESGALPRLVCSWVWCEVREEAKAIHHLVRLSTAAQDSRPAREEFLSALLSSTESKGNRCV